MNIPLTDVQSKLRGKVVKKLYITNSGIFRAYAALMQDGSVVTWGHAEYGGDSRAVQAKLK
jgi:hypothetical protein